MLRKLLSKAMIRLFLAAIIILCTLSMIMSAGVRAGFPVTLEDDLGTMITVEKEPARIISLAPSHTELLFALGLEERIVGVTTYADYPPAARKKAKVGTITEPNIEKIVSLEPDLVVAAGINKKETINRLRELGLTVAGFAPASVDEAIATMKTVGELTGQGDRTRRVVTDMYLQLSAIRELVDKKLTETGRRPTVFYEIWNEPLYTAGENTFVHDVITIAGGKNIGAAARGQWPQFNLEKLLVEDPDVYLASPHSAPHKVTVESIKNRDNYSSLSAVKNGRIYIVNQDIINRPSPRIIRGIKLVLKAIFPGLAPRVEEID